MEKSINTNIITDNFKKNVEAIIENYAPVRDNLTIQMRFLFDGLVGAYLTYNQMSDDEILKIIKMAECGNPTDAVMTVYDATVQKLDSLSNS